MRTDYDMEAYIKANEWVCQNIIEPMYTLDHWDMIGIVEQVMVMGCR